MESGGVPEEGLSLGFRLGELSSIVGGDMGGQPAERGLLR